MHIGVGADSQFAKATTPGRYANSHRVDPAESGPYATLDKVSLETQHGEIPRQAPRLAAPPAKEGASAREEVDQKVAALQKSIVRWSNASCILLAVSVGYGIIGATMPGLLEALPVVSKALPSLPDAVRGAVLMAMPFAGLAGMANLAQQACKQMIALERPDYPLGDTFPNHTE